MEMATVLPHKEDADIDEIMPGTHSVRCTTADHSCHYYYYSVIGINSFKKPVINIS